MQRVVVDASRRATSITREREAGTGAGIKTRGWDLKYSPRMICSTRTFARGSAGPARLVQLVAVVLGLVACGKKDDSSAADHPPAVAQQAEKHGVPASSPPPATTKPAPARSEYKINCDRLISKDVRDKFFNGATPEEQIMPMMGDISVTCRFENVHEARADKKVTTVAIWCTDNDAAIKPAMERKKQALKSASDVPGLGQMAFEGDIGTVHNVMVLEGDTNCYTTVTGGTQGVDISKALVGSVTPATIK
jgi:hypothetical protein